MPVASLRLCTKGPRFGFHFLQDQIEDVLEGVPSERQMMLFSATIPKHIRSLVDAYMPDAEVVDITEHESVTPASIRHVVG